MKRRILLNIQYDGTNYAGWQRQENANSVQAEIENALLMAEKNHITVIGASRTDSGVHASGQCAHFDTESRIPTDKYPFVFNSILPHDIRVISSQEVPENFHARFSAQAKKYIYRIDNSRHGSALKYRYCYHFPLPLDDTVMQSAAKLIKGEHDFTAFSATGGSHKTAIRNVYSLELKREGDLVTIIVVGNGFLYNMVRIIAGTLIWIGIKKLSNNDIILAFDTNDRRMLGPTAPAKGLELAKVFYADEWRNVHD